MRLIWPLKGSEPVKTMKTNCAYCGCLMWPAPRDPANLCTMCWVAWKCQPEADWGAVYRHNPGYVEPEVWVLQ